MTHRLPTVARLPAERLTVGCTYDAVIATIGYETRARNIAERFKPNSLRKHAFGFKQQQVLSYAENRRWFSTADFEVEDVNDTELASRFSDICAQLDSAPPANSNEHAMPTVLVDISSMTRSRLAYVIDALRGQSLTRPFLVDFLYTLALYDPPPQEEPLNSHVGPVIPAFAGWTTEPERGVAAVVGLGYEQDKALGAVEHVQAVEIWTYAPSSPIAKYTSALAEANETLLDAVAKDHQLTYEVGSPLILFGELETLIYRLCQRRNVILLPFGPKLFTLCSLLAACQHPETAVWRVSGDGLEDATDRLASEFVFGLEVCFSSDVRV